VCQKPHCSKIVGWIGCYPWYTCRDGFSTIQQIKKHLPYFGVLRGDGNDHHFAGGGIALFGISGRWLKDLPDAFGDERKHTLKNICIIPWHWIRAHATI